MKNGMIRGYDPISEDLEYDSVCNDFELNIQEEKACVCPTCGTEIYDIEYEDLEFELDIEGSLRQLGVEENCDCGDCGCDACEQWEDLEEPIEEPTELHFGEMNWVANCTFCQDCEGCLCQLRGKCTGCTCTGNGRDCVNRSACLKYDYEIDLDEGYVVPECNQCRGCEECICVDRGKCDGCTCTGDNYDVEYDVCPGMVDDTYDTTDYNTCPDGVDDGSDYEGPENPVEDEDLVEEIKNRETAVMKALMCAHDAFCGTLNDMGYDHSHYQLGTKADYLDDDYKTIISTVECIVNKYK